MTKSNQALEIFRAAYQNRYTWDENFPGYTADLEVREGEAIYRCQVKVNPDLDVEVTGIDDSKVKEGIYNQMRDIITHRRRTTFEKAHGKNSFSLGETDNTGAVEIMVQGDAMGSNYKVRNREICHVYRVMGPMAFSIDTEESLKTESGYLPTKFQALFRSSKTNELKGKRDFRETYQKVGNYYLPVCQVIDDIDENEQKISTVFEFQNLRLLEPALV